ncbi:MAG: sugar phosphate isomerase/epimerase [Streptosporangiaceae bacterium]|jgi:sugar phosphate isomerase/epimerase
MLDVAPPEFVAVAAGAGFDAVGLRVAPVTPGEEAWPVSPGSPMLAETMRRCGGTGLFVLDVEAIPLRPGSDLAGCERVLETAAVLGARYLNVICDDPDTGRFADRLAELVRLARPYRVRPVIEFTAWRPIRTLASAVAIARGSDGAGLLLDTLHIQRCGVTAAELATVDPALLGYLQLCDAPAAPPGEDATVEARTGRLLPGEGELPLAELLGALPDSLPVSAEAPSLAARRALSPAQFAARVRHALDSVLA